MIKKKKKELIRRWAGGGDTKYCPQREMMGKPRGGRKLEHQRKLAFTQKWEL